jgi:hypothetical protein
VRYGVERKLWVALYRAIVGHSRRPAALRRPDSEDGSVQSMISELEAHYGSRKAAAQAAGIPQSTWGDWKRGSHTPKTARLEKLRTAQRRSRLSDQRERKLRRSTNDGSHIVLNISIRVSSENVRNRKIVLTRWREFPAIHGIQGRILDAFLKMDSGTAVRQILDALDAGVNGSVHIEDVHDIRWFGSSAQADDYVRNSHD